MRKVLLAAMFALSATLCSAQEKRPYYCTINGSYNLAYKLRIELEWGEEKNAVHLRDEKGKKIEFKNLTDILNYMSKKGWEFVTVTYYNNCVHYLLKKDASSPEEAKEGLRFSKDTEISE